MSIKENVRKINEEIQSLDKDNDVTLCAATKYVDAEKIKELFNAGVSHMGENRVNDFLKKYEELKDLTIYWHFIGNLQSNKVRKVINKIDYLHSLDRHSLAKEINKRRHQPLNCFVEVNCSGEETKHGLKPNEVKSFIQNLEKYDKIKVIGLMTMAEHTDEEAVIRNTFKQLKKIQKEIQSLNLSFASCEHLSMGMSNDYDIAIEEGATFVRIGSRLFK